MQHMSHQAHRNDTEKSSPARNMERPPLRCLPAFLLLELLGVTAPARDGAAFAGVLGATLDACNQDRLRESACLQECKLLKVGALCYCQRLLQAHYECA